MNKATLEAVQKRIASQTGDSTTIDRVEPVGGGCINDAVCVTLTDGACFFIKLNEQAPDGMFEREAAGLEALRKAQAIRIPRVLGTGGKKNSPVPPFLVMEHIATGPQRPSFFRSFGQQFAQLHLDTQQDRFGFDQDNYLGSTAQPNGWSDDWVTFWRSCRLGHQLKLTEQTGQATTELLQLGRVLMEQLEDLIGVPGEDSGGEGACLLHGDLWSGNFLADSQGQPVLIDPAVYWGCREADLAMTTLFGGFPQAFYEGYAEVWPLAPGADRRMAVYQLYHLLNHLNLFGQGYYQQCLGLLRTLVQ